MSADPLQQLEDWAGPLLAKLGPAEQRKLARTIARDLRRSQAQRIARQQNPDGSAYEPRKPQKRPAIRDRKGGIKAMFTKLGTAAHLKQLVNGSEASLAITGRAARIALVHQYGLRDQVSPGGPSIFYPARALLGLTDAEREHVRDLLLDHITP
jgi:phage virion morphogenesis protein